MVKKSYSKHNKLLLFQYYRNHWVSLPLHTFLYPSKRMFKGIFGWETFTTYSLNYVGNILETLEKDLRHMLAKVQRRKVELAGSKILRNSTKGGSCSVRYTEESILGEATYKQDPDLAAHKAARCWLPKGTEVTGSSSPSRRPPTFTCLPWSHDTITNIPTSIHYFPLAFQTPFLPHFSPFPVSILPLCT